MGRSETVTRADRAAKGGLLVNLTAGVAGLMVAGVALTAQAVPINGSIIFTGGATVNNTGLGDATEFIGFSSLNVLGGAESGSYLPLNGGGTFGGTLSFSPFGFGGNVLNPNPVVLWQVTAGGLTYSFVANSVTIDYQATEFLNVSGTGTAKITGVGSPYNDTFGSWTIATTTQGGGSAVFTFGASTVVEGETPVPDGGTTAILLALGIFGVAVIRRQIA